MSRTYRRKNAWQENDYVSDYVEDVRKWNHISRYKKYEELSDEKVYDIFYNWYHSDCPKYWSEGAYKKEHARRKLRPKNKQELIRALKEGEEENLQLTTTRELFGEWWYYN